MYSKTLGNRPIGCYILAFIMNFNVSFMASASVQTIEKSWKFNDSVVCNVNNLKKNTDNINNNFSSLVLTFPSRLNIEECLTLDGWERSFKLIEEDISFLTRDHNLKILEIIGPSLQYICGPFCFSRFVHFCSSSVCTPQVKNIISTFLLLGCRVIQEISQKRLSNELEERVENALKENLPLVSDDDAPLFSQIQDVLEKALQPKRLA